MDIFLPTQSTMSFGAPDLKKSVLYCTLFIMTSGSDTVGKRCFFLWRIICQSDLSNDALSKITFSSLFSVSVIFYVYSPE